jgi:hypothetical protein
VPCGVFPMAFKCPFGLATVCPNPAHVNRERILGSYIM